MMTVILSKSMIAIINIEMITTIVLSAAFAFLFAVYVGSSLVRDNMKK